MQSIRINCVGNSKLGSILFTFASRIFASFVLLMLLWSTGSGAQAASRGELEFLAKDIIQASSGLNEAAPAPQSYDAQRAAIGFILAQDKKGLATFLETRGHEIPHYRDLFEAYNTLSNIKTRDISSTKSYGFFLKALSEGGWERKYFANLMLLNIHVLRNEPFRGKVHGKNALQLVQIGEETDSRFDAATKAILCHDVYVTLRKAYIMDGSLEGTLEATGALKDLSKEAGQDLDGFELVLNLADVLSKHGRNEDATAILKLLSPYINEEPKARQLSYHLAMGHLYNAQTNHEDAFAHLDRALSLAKGAAHLADVYNELAMSHIYMGDVDSSRRYLAKLESLIDTRARADEFQLPILKVKSHIAEKEGFHRKSTELHKSYISARADLAEKSLLEEHAEAAKRVDFVQALALENSLSHNRENILKDMVIDREKNINRITSALFAITLLALAMLYLLYRRVRLLNVELLHSRDKALVAEKAKTNFLAVMSHEVRTPLNSIIPVAELLKAKPLYQEDKGLLSLIAAGGDNLLRMLDNILVVSENSARPKVHHEPLNLIEISKPILRNFAAEARSHNVALMANVARGFPRLFCTDKGAVESILRNLLSNAVKFTPPGNEIKACFDFEADTGKVSISIRDTGIGIKSDEITNYLEPFTQKETGTRRSYEGLGIGLSVVNLEVERLGGTIEFITDHPAGTEVIVTLPNMMSLGQEGEGTQERAA